MSSAAAAFVHSRLSGPTLGTSLRGKIASILFHRGARAHAHPLVHFGVSIA